jgi:hypothetical protein
VTSQPGQERQGQRRTAEGERTAAEIAWALGAADAQAEKVRAQAARETQRLRARKHRDVEPTPAPESEGGELAERAERAARITREARDLVADALGDMRRIASELQSGIAAVDASVKALTALAREIEPESASSKQGSSTGSEQHDRAPIVRAVQMAMAGASRFDIDAILRDEFGIEDTAVILDEALGPP